MTLSQFHRAYEAAHYRLDSEKRGTIDPPASQALHVVAGPGTGKTTAVVARVLKLVYVDGLDPAGIVATTFTKKAANELRSRILEVAFPLADALQAVCPELDRARIREIDVNQVWTGTTDSLCQELLTLHRPPGEQIPVVADEYVTRTLMLNNAVFGNGRYRDPLFRNYLQYLSGESAAPNVGRMVDLVAAIADRRHHDQVDMDRYLATAPPGAETGRRALAAALEAYDSAMADRGLVDYAGIEAETLRRLRAGLLSEFLGSLQAVLVDEYQDTNLLQEQLYLELARGCGGAITVVGDDDQSLYRFRGATVELFTDFPDRCARMLGRRPATEYLTTNHRSSESIVEFVNAFAGLDPGYQVARSAAKPALASRPGRPRGLPVLAMFRSDVVTLAEDLADFLEAVFRGSGVSIPGHGRLTKGTGGDLGDAALLAFSPKENVADRLVPQIRHALEYRGMGMFNPRGQATQHVPLVELLGGLSLLALDEHDRYRPFLSPAGATAFDQWRNKAGAELGRVPALHDLVQRWQRRDRDSRWPDRTPYLDLLYGIAQLLPGALDGPEQQLFVELFARQTNAAEQIGSFLGQILHARTGSTSYGNPRSVQSTKELLKNVLGPVAEGSVTVNEELIEDFPHDRLTVLSIHQAKGLEFPLTIVDAGSRFKGDHWKQAHWRFPREGSTPHRLEDEFRGHSPLGPPIRSQIDRAFDDVIRQYFVAYSRPRNVLLLVGLDSARPESRRIPALQLGWDRQRHSTWASTRPYLEV